MAMRALGRVLSSIVWIALAPSAGAGQEPIRTAPTGVAIALSAEPPGSTLTYALADPSGTESATGTCTTPCAVGAGWWRGIGRYRLTTTDAGGIVSATAITLDGDERRIDVTARLGREGLRVLIERVTERIVLRVTDLGAPVQIENGTDEDLVVLEDGRRTSWTATPDDPAQTQAERDAHRLVTWHMCGLGMSRAAVPAHGTTRLRRLDQLHVERTGRSGRHRGTVELTSPDAYGSWAGVFVVYLATFAVDVVRVRRGPPCIARFEALQERCGREPELELALPAPEISPDAAH